MQHVRTSKVVPPRSPNGAACPSPKPRRASGRHCALVSWGRPRAVARGRQGGWAQAVAKAVPEPQSPPEQPQPR